MRSFHTVRQVYERLVEAAPLELAMGFDNPGLLVGDRSAQVGAVLLCLDITDRVIDEAIALGCGVIVSHHPLFFELPKQLLGDAQGPVGRTIRLLRAGLSAICLHTNMDVAQGGVNDLLLGKLGLSPEAGLPPEAGEGFIGRIGSLRMALRPAELAAGVRRRLGCDAVRYVAGHGEVRRVAVVGGAGGGFYEAAAARGCDALVTAEVKHHHFLEAEALGLTLVDAGHFHTERFVVERFEALIGAGCPGLAVHRSRTVERDLVQTISS